MRALRHANTTANMYPGLKNNDVFLQIIDLDKGIYGQPFLVSLFLHVRFLFFLDDDNLNVVYHISSESVKGGKVYKSHYDIELNVLHGI